MIGVIYRLFPSKPLRNRWNEARRSGHADRLPHQPLPEPLPQLHPPRDPRARAPRHRDPPLRAPRRPVRARRRCRHRRARADRARPASGWPAAARGGACGNAAFPAGGSRGAAAGRPAGPPLRSRAWPCTSSISSRPPTSRSAAERWGSSICTRISAPIRPRWRCLLPPSAALPGASPCMAPRSSTNRASSRSTRRCAARRSRSPSARSGAASSAAGSDATPGRGSMSSTAASSPQRFAGRRRLRPAERGLVAIGRLVEQKGQLLLARGAVGCGGDPSVAAPDPGRRRRDARQRSRRWCAHAVFSRT